MSEWSRRELLRYLAIARGFAGTRSGFWSVDQPHFSLSVSERSFADSIRRGEMNHLDFCSLVSRDLKIQAVDYDTSLFRDQLFNDEYVSEMNKRAADCGVRHVLLMVEQEAGLGAERNRDRRQAVTRHRAIIDMAAALGCRGICVPIGGQGTAAELADRLSDTLSELAERGQGKKIQVMVSNRDLPTGGLVWLQAVVQKVDSSHCTIIPAFDGLAAKERIEGFRTLIGQSKGVIAAVDSIPDEETPLSRQEFLSLLEVIVESSYRGYVSLEFNSAGSHTTEGLGKIRQLVDLVRLEPAG